MIAEILAATLAVLCIVLAVEWRRTARRLARANEQLEEHTRRTLARVKRKSDASKRGWVTRKRKGGAV